MMGIWAHPILHAVAAASADEPQRVNPPIGAGLLGPVVVVLLAVLVVAPAMRVRVSVRRREGSTR